MKSQKHANIHFLRIINISSNTAWLNRNIVWINKTIAKQSTNSSRRIVRLKYQRCSGPRSTNNSLGQFFFRALLHSLFSKEDLHFSRAKNFGPKLINWKTALISLPNDLLELDANQSAVRRPLLCSWTLCISCFNRVEYVHVQRSFMLPSACEREERSN